MAGCPAVFNNRAAADSVYCRKWADASTPAWRKLPAMYKWGGCLALGRFLFLLSSVDHDTSVLLFPAAAVLHSHLKTT